MKKCKRIHPNNQPIRLPLLSSVILWIVLDKLQAAEWVKGVSWTIMGFLWLFAIVCIYNSESLDEIK